MEISVIASGSNGNSCLVESKDSSVLIDAGKSCREIEYRLNNLGKNLENVDGILMTHAHIDHTLGIGPISRKYNIPVYVKKDAYDISKLGKIDVKHFKGNFKIKDLTIKPIKTSHDVPSTGFLVNNFGLFTDTGIVTNEMKDAVKKVEGMLLESNHDIDMLLNGRYPAFLKQRILSDNGHLSNISASSFIQEKGNDLNFVLLGHLSGNNNTPDITKKTFETLVKRKIDFNVCSRDKESGVWEV
jgi:phosphoribosyl 1,2-cyclic phosphodiesterase|tara:strand:+ start:69 stop:797 length:729 start_codon:yes stop_codon:yes gene_type:complete